jgi:PKD repeat protein
MSRLYKLLPVFILVLLGIALFSCKPKVKEKPSAEFSPNKRQVNVGDTVRFKYELNNYDKLSWDFGDSSYSEEKNPVHVYKKADSYWVTFKVIKGSDTAVNADLKISVLASNDSTSVSDTLAKGNELTAKGDSVRKKGSVTVWPSIVFPGEKTRYTATAEVPFIMDLGGKSKSEAKGGEIMFDEIGQYLIKLTDKTTGAVLDKKTVSVIEKIEDAKFSSWLEDLANDNLTRPQKEMLRNKIYGYCLKNGEIPVTGGSQESDTFKDFVSNIIIESSPYQKVTIAVRIQFNSFKKISSVQLDTYVKKEI